MPILFIQISQVGMHCQLEVSCFWFHFLVGVNSSEYSYVHSVYNYNKFDNVGLMDESSNDFARQI